MQYSYLWFKLQYIHIVCPWSSVTTKCQSMTYKTHFWSIEQKINRISDFFDRIRIRGINTITHFSYWSSLVWWTRYPGVTFIDFIFLYAITDTTFTWKNIPCWQIKLESIVSITIQYWIGYVYFAIIVDSFLQ